MPRLSGLDSWLKKQPSSSRTCASRSRASIKRWKKRADDCVLDWAELFTDPVALAEGFAGHATSPRSDIERLVAWVKRQLAKPQKAPVDEEGNPVLDSEGLPVGARRG